MVNNFDNIKFGSVFFDDPESPQDGWAALYDTEKKIAEPFRIQGTGSLTSEAVWLSNLSYDNSYQAGLIDHPRIKISSFYRSDIRTLMREFGFGEGDFDDAASFFAEQFYRTMTLCHKHYHIKTIGLTLKDTLRPALLRADRRVDNAGLAHAFDSAMQTIQRCEGRTPKGSKMLSFRFPRVAYAKKILEFPVPSGKWKEVKGAVSADQVAEKFSKKPVICRINVEDIRPDLVNLVSFSNGAKNPRFWATSQEIYYLNKIAEVEILSSFVCDEYTTMSTMKPLIDEGVAGDLSVSTGLIAENHWVACASQFRSRSGEQIISGRAVWMRSWDRMICYLAAKSFHDAGFHVKSYGTGSVLLAVPVNMFDYCLDIAAELDLLPPIQAIKELTEEFADGLD